MKHFTLLLAFLSLLSFQHTISAQSCASNESEVVISILTDNYAYETGWTLTDASGNLYADAPAGTYQDNATLFLDTICVPQNICMTFSITDEFGDGICCGYGTGSYEVIVDGVIVATGGEFGDLENTSFNCPPGSTCSDGIVVVEGAYTTLFNDTWYVFSPSNVGMYKITTCALGNTCDTKIWIYDSCPNTVGESNAGTIYYEDDPAGCGTQAVLNVALDTALTYYIRIGDDDDDCVGTAINWELIYNGEIVGCTDPDACNYNPLATISDTLCLYTGDPGCTGPDLWLLQDVIESSIYLDSYNSTDNCAISEGCIQGYGDRDIVRFTTHIKNIGDTDYLIGSPSANPDQFTYDNCHNHNHYDGYAEYILYDELGVALPIGFKNGFCVMDLECSDGGTAQYGCSFMGISAGCGDIYGSGLSCQWIDVTDVADGTYTFVARTNWDNAPDALGRYETDSSNNWAQVCITLDRSSGTLAMNVATNCDPFVDCAGEIYGPAQPDCNGVCNGSALMGDLDANALQEFADAQGYVTSILGNDITPTPCNDLNADEAITVYDAALMASCLNYGQGHLHPDSGAHDHCSFPAGISNPFDTVTFSINDINYADQYIDIDITNPTAFVNAYQFTMSGVEISSVQNLVDPAIYPITPQTAPLGNMVIGISYEDSLILKSITPQPLCRVYYMNLTGTEVCIESVIDVVNQDYEQTAHKIENACLQLVGTQNAQFEIKTSLTPNPLIDESTLSFPNSKNEIFSLKITDATGREVQNHEEIRGNSFIIKREKMESGIYFYYLESEKSKAVGKIVVY